MADRFTRFAFPKMDYIYNTQDELIEYLKKSYGIYSKANKRMEGIAVWHRKFSVTYDINDVMDIDVRIESYDGYVVVRYWYKYSKDNAGGVVVTTYDCK